MDYYILDDMGQCISGMLSRTMAFDQASANSTLTGKARYVYRGTGRGDDFLIASFYPDNE